jgi:hypothetical protein
VGPTRGVPQGGFPQGESSRGGPPRRVPQGWSPKAAPPRVVSQRGSPKGVPPRGVPQGGSPKGVPLGSSSIFVQPRWSPKGFSQNGDPNAWPQGVCKEMVTQAVPPGGSPKGVPSGSPSGGFTQGVLPACVPRCCRAGGFLQVGSPAVVLQGCPLRLVPLMWCLAMVTPDLSRLKGSPRYLHLHGGCSFSPGDCPLKESPEVFTWWAPPPPEVSPVGVTLKGLPESRLYVVFAGRCVLEEVAGVGSTRRGSLECFNCFPGYIQLEESHYRSPIEMFPAKGPMGIGPWFGSPGVFP